MCCPWSERIERHRALSKILSYCITICDFSLGKLLQCRLLLCRGYPPHRHTGIDDEALIAVIKLLDLVLALDEVRKLMGRVPIFGILIPPPWQSCARWRGTDRRHYWSWLRCGCFGKHNGHSESHQEDWDIWNPSSIYFLPSLVLSITVQVRTLYLWS